jgi:hypothetical protein
MVPSERETTVAVPVSFVIAKLNKSVVTPAPPLAMSV